MPDLRNIIEEFVTASIQPVVLDSGEEPLPLVRDQWSLSEWNGRLVLQAWDQHRNLVRKVVGLKEQRRDRLNLITERFHKSEADLQIADLAVAAGRELSRKAFRMAFRERLQLMLAREWPDLRIAELSAEPNLEESLSAAYTRALLVSGQSGIAVMAASNDAGSFCGIVPAGVIWLNYLRKRERKLAIQRLLLYVPFGCERDTAFRARCLDRAKIACDLFTFDAKDYCVPVDFADCGNIDSTLPPCRQPVGQRAAMDDLPALEDADRVEKPDGSVSFEIRGLEFARLSAGKLSCGIARRRRADIETVRMMASEIARVRNAAAEDRQNPLYTMNPEGWLESQVRSHPEIIDASLRTVPIYGQVPIFSGPERGVIDLLGIDHTGRLVIIELKATADLDLPFQALDYWLRVKKHLAAGDFERLGYFAGHTIRRESPRILLVAPALEFHSTSEAMISALAPDVEVTRIGLAANWRAELRVMFRLRGDERP